MPQSQSRQSQIHNAIMLERWRQEYALVNSDITQKKQISDAEYLKYWADANSRLNQKQKWVDDYPQDIEDYQAAVNKVAEQTAIGIEKINTQLSFISPIMIMTANIGSLLSVPVKCIYNLRMPTKGEWVHLAQGAASIALLSVLLFSGAGVVAGGFASVGLAGLNVFKNWYDKKRLEGKWLELNEQAREREKNIEELMKQLNELNSKKNISLDEQKTLSNLSVALRHHLDIYTASGIEMRSVHAKLAKFRNAVTRDVVGVMGVLFLIGALLLLIPTPISFIAVSLMVISASIAALFTIGAALLQQWEHHQAAKKVARDAANAIQKGEYTPQTEYEKEYANIVSHQKELESQLKKRGVEKKEIQAENTAPDKKPAEIAPKKKALSRESIKQLEDKPEETTHEKNKPSIK